ncbi:MAG TPA: alpha/beta hydrolase, partial [Chitinophagales bacterium]|nr:alpha/beta hydrolase [Chitinophagales bacterium]
HSKINDKTRTMYTELNRRAGNRQAFLSRARNIRQSSEDDLTPITAPTLVLWGREDVLIDVAMSEHFKKITHSTEIIYDKVGHSPQEEIPERSAADVMRFLKSDP